MRKPIQHIAVIRLSAMGDVAMTVPVLRALVKQHPEIKITMVSRAFFKPLFDGIPKVDFLAADTGGRHKGFLGLFRLYSDITKCGIDAIADLHHVLRSNIICKLSALSGIKTISVDKARAEKKALTRPENKIFKPLRPITDRYADVFAKLGFKVDLSRPDFSERQRLNSGLLKVTGEKSGKWLGIAPFAKHDSKIYPKDLMQEVLDGLSVDQNLKIFLFGAGKHEGAILDEFAKDKKNVINTAGQFSFSEELRLISNLDLMLSMDSGNAHLAAIYGIPTITLWGSTHPYTGFAPFGQPSVNAIVSDRKKFPKLPTSVYGNKRVEGYEDAMRTITPQMVIDKIKSLLC